MAISSGKKTTKAKSASRRKASLLTSSRVGNIKLGKKSFFKGWMLILAIVFAVTIGWATLRFSEASSYAFTFHTDKMNGGSVVSKANGVTYRHLTDHSGGPEINAYYNAAVNGGYGSSGSLQGKAQVGNIQKFCMHYISAKGLVTMSVPSPIGTTITNGWLITKNGGGQLCIPTNGAVSGNIKIWVDAGGANTTSDAYVNVDTIYGVTGVATLKATLSVDTPSQLLSVKTGSTILYHIRGQNLGDGAATNATFASQLGPNTSNLSFVSVGTPSLNGKVLLPPEYSVIQRGDTVDPTHLNTYYGVILKNMAPNDVLDFTVLMKVVAGKTNSTSACNVAAAFRASSGSDLNPITLSPAICAQLSK